jgi:hypothetical protein
VGDENFANDVITAKVQSEQPTAAEKSDVGRAFLSAIGLAPAERPTFEAELSGVNPDLQKTRPVAAPSTETTPEAPAASEATAETAAAVESGSAEQAALPVDLKVDRAAPRRPARRAAGREEKIADRLNPTNRAWAPQGVVPAKTFVSAAQQEVRGGEGIVGTDVAKSGPAMPFALAAHHSPTGSPVLPASDAQSTTFDLSAATEPVQQARDTVATVMQVIDAQEKPAMSAARAVNLDFQFGEERLAVRVEFRDGMVRAHFRTQSLELRSALAQEWSHVAAAPENVLRLAEPTFVTSSRAEQSASFNADGGAARQQSQQGQTPASAIFSRPAPAGFRSAPVTADLPEAPRLRHLSTVRHLQAVA